MLGLGIISPIMPLYASDLGANLVQIGLLSSAWSISRLIFTAPAGRYSDRGSKKRVIMAGLLVYAVISFLYVLAWDFTSLISIRFLHGLGSAMTMPIAMAYGAVLAPRGKEGRYMGLMTSAMFAGMGLGPYLGGTLTDIFGSKSVAFYAMGGLSALSLFLVAVFLPDQRVESDRGDMPRPSFMKVLSIRILRAAFIYRVVGALGRGSVMGFLSMYLSNPVAEGGLGISYSILGLILTVSQLSSAFLQGAGGQVQQDKADPAGWSPGSPGVGPHPAGAQHLGGAGRSAGLHSRRGRGDAGPHRHSGHRGEGDRNGDHHERPPELHESGDDRRSPAVRDPRRPVRPEDNLLHRQCHISGGDFGLLRPPKALIPCGCTLD